jgi:hypothetical protein
MSRLKGFYLLGTDKEMITDSALALLEDESCQAIFLARIAELNATMQRHGHSLNKIASDFPPSVFASSTATIRNRAADVLETSPEYCKRTEVFWERDSFLTLALAKGIAAAEPIPDNECNYVALAQNMCLLAKGDSEGVYLESLGLANLACNDTTTCEEFRSSACSAVLSMFLPRNIVLVHQLLVYIRSSKASCIDLAMDMVPTRPNFSVLFEFKVKVTEGSLNEAFMNASTLMHAQKTTKVLLFVIEGSFFSVHVVFWSNGRCNLVQLQPLISTDSDNYNCFANWLRAAVWFSCHANLVDNVLNRPFLCISEKCYAMRSVYQDGERVIKVYDTVNKSPDQISDVCRPNIPLVQEFYPQPVEVLFDFPEFCAISFPAVFSKNPHIPKSVEQLSSFFAEVKRFHTLGYLLADLRPPNVLYPDLEDTNHAPGSSYLIDFDLARPCDHQWTYPATFRSEGLEIVRHPDAVAGAVIKEEHDIHAVHECLKYYARADCCDAVKSALALIDDNDSLDVLLSRFE